MDPATWWERALFQIGFGIGRGWVYALKEMQVKDKEPTTDAEANAVADQLADAVSGLPRAPGDPGR